jgi:ribosomal protein S14
MAYEIETQKPMPKILDRDPNSCEGTGTHHGNIEKDPER